MRRNHWLVRWMVMTAGVVTPLLAGCGSDPEAPEQPAAELRLEAQSDTTLTGIVGANVAGAPVVRLTTRAGAPASGREVRFLVSGGGSIGRSSGHTDVTGIVSPGFWTLGTAAGSQTLTAHADGAADIVFTASATAGQPGALAIRAGNDQTAAAGAALPVALQVQLVDQYGNPLTDVPVTHAVITGSGTVAGDTAKTDASGVATLGPWTLGRVGAQLLSVSAAGKHVLFEAFACGDPCRGRDLLFGRGSALYSRINGTETLLFDGLFADYRSAWSPDARRIAFTVYDAKDPQDLDDDEGDLYVMDANGSHAALLAHGFVKPSWAPDGRHVVAWGLGGLYALDAEPDGTPPVLLHQGGIDPAWSPDGARIAFVDATNSGGSLALMNPDGSAVTTLVPENANVWINDPTWSPDGRRLAFTKCVYVPTTVCNLFAVGADGAGLMQLTTVNTASRPAWSPDGSRIAFGSGRDVVWIPADGGPSQPFALVANATSPAWRP